MGVTGPRRPPASARSRTLAVSALATGLLLAVGIALPMPYAVTSPGPTVNTLGEQGGEPLITVTGAPTYPPSGELRLTTVSSTGAPGFPTSSVAAVRGWFARTALVEPVEDVFPPDLTADQISSGNAAAMTESQQNATVAALTELGYDIPVTLSVAGVIPGSAVAGVVENGDVLRTVDGTAITSYAQLAQIMAGIAPGTTISLGVLRDGADLTLTVRTVPPVDGNGQPSDAPGSQIGITVSPSYDLPVQVSIRIEDIGGASAGTMFALGIIDLLTPQDEANGAIVAGTGTMDLAGRVGRIGGIRQKMAGAARDGAAWFLAPADNCPDVVGHVPDGLRVVRVATLHEARQAMVAIGAGTADNLPTCG